MEIKIKKLHKNAIIPSIATSGSAGVDLCACCDSDILIKANGEELINTGLAMSINQGFAGFIYARSGLATKSGITLKNAVGVIDSDYRGEIMIALKNISDTDFIIHNGDRIAQMVIKKVETVEFVECDDLDETIRNERGFGSSGTSSLQN